MPGAVSLDFIVTIPLPTALHTDLHNSQQCCRILAGKAYLHNDLVRLQCVWQAQERGAQVGPAAGQAKGRTLLNLRVAETETGLLGRTLLTLVSNKVHLAAVLEALMAPEHVPMKYLPGHKFPLWPALRSKP